METLFLIVVLTNMKHWTRVRGLLGKYYLNYIVEIQFSLFLMVGGDFSGVYLRYNVVLVSGVQQREYIYPLGGGVRLFSSHISHYSVLSRVPCVM